MVAFYYTSADFETELLAFIQGIPKTETVALSSVVDAKRFTLIKSLLSAHFISPLKIAQPEPSFQQTVNGYEDYSALGVDRWLALIAVSSFKGHKLIIDAGSWITIDLMIDNAHQGGMIISRDEKAQQQLIERFAIKTPNTQNKPSWGNSTQQGIQIAFNQFGVSAIQPLLALSLEQTQDYQVIISGGDAPKVEQHIQQLAETQNLRLKDIQRIENLVLLGLSIRYPDRAL